MHLVDRECEDDAKEIQWLREQLMPQTTNYDLQYLSPVQDVDTGSRHKEPAQGLALSYTVIYRVFFATA